MRVVGLAAMGLAAMMLAALAAMTLVVCGGAGAWSRS
jgi:hypothetical protein